MSRFKRSVVCPECRTPVERRSNLIVAWRWLVLTPFHAACYAKQLKGFGTIGLINRPINGSVGTLLAILFFMGAIALFGLSFTEATSDISFGSTDPQRNLLGADEETQSMNSAVGLRVIAVLFLMHPSTRLISWFIYERNLH